MDDEVKDSTVLSDRVEKLRKHYQELRSVPGWDEAEVAEAQQLKHDLLQCSETLQGVASGSDHYRLWSHHCSVMATSLDREIARVTKKRKSSPGVRTPGRTPRRSNKRPAPTKKKHATSAVPAEPQYRKLHVIGVDKATGKAVLRLIDTGPGTRPDKPADPAGHTYGRTEAKSKKKKKKNPAEETSKKQRHSTEDKPKPERRQKRKYIVVSNSGYIHTVSAGLPGLGKRR